MCIFFVQQLSSYERNHNKILEVESTIPIGSMYGIFTCIWLICMVNVGKYSIHGSYGICVLFKNHFPNAFSTIVSNKHFFHQLLEVRLFQWQIRKLLSVFPETLVAECVKTKHKQRLGYRWKICCCTCVAWQVLCYIILV